VRDFVKEKKAKNDSVPLVEGFEIWGMPKSVYPIEKLVAVVQKLIGG